MDTDELKQKRFELAERDNRCIIGYSVHEYDVIKKMVPEYTEKLNLYYRNALQLAKRGILIYF